MGQQRAMKVATADGRIAIGLNKRDVEYIIYYEDILLKIGSGEDIARVDVVLAHFEVSTWESIQYMFLYNIRTGHNEILSIGREIGRSNKGHQLIIVEHLVCLCKKYGILYRDR
jgi:hypothetical protein